MDEGVVQEGVWESYLRLLHDGARRGSVDRQRPPTHLRRAVHRQGVTVDILLLFAGGLQQQRGNGELNHVIYSAWSVWGGGSTKAP